MKKNQINILRWLITGAFFASFVFFLLPYISLTIDGFSKGISGLMCFFADLADVKNAGSLIFRLVFFLAPVCLTLISGVVLAIKLEKKRFLISAILGLIAAILYISYFVYFKTILDANGVKNGEVTLGVGFYCNAVLSLLAGIMSIVLYVMFGKSSSVSSAKRPQSAAGTGVITGISGMYKNAAFNLENGEEIIIGRDSLKAHVIVDQDADKISRKHCGIIFDAASRTCSVIDYSSNGTFKEDGTRFMANMPTPVPNGTVIILGSKQNSFRLN